MRKTTLAIALATALSAGVAAAQTSPGAERQPSGPPNAGDTRAIPGPDQRPGVPPRVQDTPRTTVDPADRQMQPAGPPNAGDTRAIPGDARRADRSGRSTTWRDRFFSPTPESTAQTWENGGKAGPYGSGLGSPQYRFDGPDQGRFVDPVKV